MRNFSGSIERLTKSKDFTIVPNGKETVLSLVGNKYLVNKNDGTISGTFISWNNIPLKIIINNGTGQEVVQAISIDTFPLKDATIFNLPKDIEIINAINPGL